MHFIQIMENGIKYDVILHRAAREQWKVLILHSLVSSEEQREVFKPVEGGLRKIILSTNIAESSITVPDVKYGKRFFKYFDTRLQYCQ